MSFPLIRRSLEYVYVDDWAYTHTHTSQHKVMSRMCTVLRLGRARITALTFLHPPSICCTHAIIQLIYMLSKWIHCRKWCMFCPASVKCSLARSFSFGRPFFFLSFAFAAFHSSDIYSLAWLRECARLLIPKNQFKSNKDRVDPMPSSSSDCLTECVCVSFAWAFVNRSVNVPSYAASARVSWIEASTVVCVRLCGI